MPTTNTHKQTLLDKWTKPLNELIPHCIHKRECNKLSDEKWLETGILRTLSQEPSGRAFLQVLLDIKGEYLKRSHYFETLKSPRRLKFIKEVNSLLLEKLSMERKEADPFKEYLCLSGYDIYAGDGHYHASAVHDPKKPDKKYPTLHFYALNLRSYALNHLTVADTSGARKKEHDMHALKRLSIESLRQNAPAGKKVLYIWDRAGIDFVQWYKWKHNSGIYFVSREKTNMNLMTLAHLEYDKSDSINYGVEAYELVGTNSGTSIYRITYKCPVSGNQFVFLTNLAKMPPGLIAFLYKTRWDIEKVFDQVKNKMVEKKAWATSDNAKTMQAEFICLSHNLMLILEDLLKTEESIEDNSEYDRRRKRVDAFINIAKEKGLNLPGYYKNSIRLTQRSVKFIRWLRNNIFNQAAWHAAIAALRQVYAVF